jgi:hypothetical protein
MKRKHSWGLKSNKKEIKRSNLMHLSQPDLTVIRSCATRAFSNIVLASFSRIELSSE